jgi:hypothetical protein
MQLTQDDFEVPLNSNPLELKPSIRLQEMDLCNFIVPDFTLISSTSSPPAPTPSAFSIVLL